MVHAQRQKNVGLFFMLLDMFEDQLNLLAIANKVVIMLVCATERSPVHLCLNKRNFKAATTAEGNSASAECLMSTLVTSGKNIKQLFAHLPTLFGPVAFRLNTVLHKWLKGKSKKAHCVRQAHNMPAVT